MRITIISAIITSYFLMLSNKIEAQITSTFHSCEFEWMISNGFAYKGIDTFKFKITGDYRSVNTEVEYAYGEDELVKVLRRIGASLCQDSSSRKGVLAIELEIGIDGKITSSHIAHSLDKNIDLMVLKELEVTNGKWRAATGRSGIAINSFLMIIWKLNIKN